MEEGLREVPVMVKTLRGDFVGEEAMGENFVGEEITGEDFVEEKTLGEDFVGEEVLGKDTVVVKKLEKYLVVGAYRLGERGMRNQMGFWDLHPESITYNKLYCLILCEINIPSFY